MKTTFSCSEVIANFEVEQEVGLYKKCDDFIRPSFNKILGKNFKMHCQIAVYANFRGEECSKIYLFK